MVLGNTFHLFIQPGHELIAELGGLHEFMGWRAADHHRLGRLPGLLDGPRVGGRRDQAPARRARAAWPILEIDEEGVRFRSYIDGSRALHGPGDLDGGAGRARLGHRAGLRRVHAVPRRARLHRALDASAPTAGSTAASTGAPRTRPPASCSTGSCRAACTRTCGPSRRPTSRGAGVDGIAIGGSLGAGQGADARGGRLGARRPARRAPAAPARDRRRRRHRPRGRRRHRHLRLRDAHAPGAPRHRAGARPRERAGGST